jgi:hypothetical protein
LHRTFAKKFNDLIIINMQNSNSKTRIFECEIEDGQTMYFKLNRTKKTASVIFKKTYSGSVVIPATIAVDGISFTVTAIEGKTFNKCPCTAITIPAGVTAIGEKSFLKCTDLTSINVDGSNPNYLSEAGILFDRNKTTLIRYPQGKTGTYTIPDSVTAIGNYAFANCSGLTSVIIPDSVTAIGNCAFAKCSGLTSVTVPDSVTAIGNHAFAECYGLTSVTIPNSVTVIGHSAFHFCKSLTSVTIPDSVTTIDKYAFSGCSLISVTIPDSVTTISDDAFSCCRSLTSVIIPDSVTVIGDHAFSYCESLTSVIIPDSITVIGDHAFSGCDGLTSVTIPAGVTAIGDGVWNSCNDLTSITVDSNNPNYSSEAGVLFDKNKTTLIQCPAGKTGKYTIPESVADIEYHAFITCEGLTSINVESNNPNYSSKAGVLFDKDKTTLIQYPAGKTGGYTIPDSVTAIDFNAFWGCKRLTSITIPDSVTAIGDHAFLGCSGLTSITIPDSVTAIAEYAFFLCSGLTSVTIPAGITAIGEWVFFHCKSLTSVTVPNSVTVIGCNAFGDCESLISITIPAGVTAIGDFAFHRCKSLTEIHNKRATPQKIDTTVFKGINKKNCTLYVPESAVAVYNSASGWKAFANIVGEKI